MIALNNRETSQMKVWLVCVLGVFIYHGNVYDCNNCNKSGFYGIYPDGTGLQNLPTQVTSMFCQLYVFSD